MSDLAGSLPIIVIAICVTIYYIMKLRYHDVAKEIEKLGELKEKGLLTDDEFHERKKKLLKS